MTAKIFVYRNLHKKCYSIRRHGRVYAHSEWVLMNTVFPADILGFQVSEAGRRRVIATKRKNVHAFAWSRGGNVLYGSEHEENTKHWFKALQKKGILTQVSYNPYKHGYFFNKESNAPIEQARYIFLTPDGVWV